MRYLLVFLLIILFSCNKDCPNLGCRTTTLNPDGSLVIWNIETNTCDYERAVEALYQVDMNGEFYYQDSVKTIVCE